MATITAGTSLPLNIDQLDVGVILSGVTTSSSSAHVQIQTDPTQVLDLYGAFQLGANSQLAGGILTEFKVTISGALLFDITGVAVPVVELLAWAATDSNATAEASILSGSDLIYGTPFNDVLRGFGGNDTFVASPGIDIIDGGSGLNTVVFHDGFVNYVLATSATGEWDVQDARSGALDGSEILSGIRSLQFPDRTVVIGAPPSAATMQQLNTQFRLVVRETSDSVLASSPQQLADGTTNPAFMGANLLLPLASQLDSGLTSAASVASQIAGFAEATSSVATLAYEFFTGAAPSAAGMDYLVSPTGPNTNNLNSAYYQSFSLENRYINFAVNLGHLGAGEAAFQAGYGSLSFPDAVTQAYASIFGQAPSAAKVDVLLNTLVTSNGVTETRAQYFAYYGQDGPAGLGAKAAMVGWLLAEAVKADVGTYALSNDAFLADVALHNAPFGVDVVGVYGQAAFIFYPG